MLKSFATSLLMVFAMHSLAADYQQWDGRQLMQEVQHRHEQYPFVYEEQVMVLTDQQGNRNTRKLTRYSRIDNDGEANYLLLFHYPEEIRGVAILAHSTDGRANARTHVYLPALGRHLVQSDNRASDHLLGSDFTLENLQSEDLGQYRYQRQNNQTLEGVDYFVVEAHGKQHPYTHKQHYIRKDNFYITRTDVFDKQQQLHKRQSQHDLVSLGAQLWRANMVLVEDFKKKHRSLLKISKRVFSQDYVPQHIFSLDWLVQNHTLTIATDEAK